MTKKQNIREEMALVSKEAIELCVLLCGPKAWHDSDPIPVAVSVPKKMIELATSLGVLNPEMEFVRQEFLQAVVGDLVMRGLRHLSDEKTKDLARSKSEIIARLSKIVQEAKGMSL